jgi:GntR family transcriptional repressor for pyruvate dehydrogenase complex
MGTMLEPIDNRSVVAKIIDIMSDLIVEKKIKVGDRIPSEYQIASQLKVSRTSVREALRVLSAFGVLEIRRGDGTYVSNKIRSSRLESLSYSLIMEDSSKEDIVDLRVMLDLGLYYLLISRIQDEDILTLEKKIVEQEEFLGSGSFDDEKYIDLDIEFHLSIARITKNVLIEKIYVTIMRLFRASMLKALKTIEPRQVIENHKEIVKLFREKNVGAIREVITRNTSRWQTSL